MSAELTCESADLNVPISDFVVISGFASVSRSMMLTVSWLEDGELTKMGFTLSFSQQSSLVEFISSATATASILLGSSTSTTAVPLGSAEFSEVSCSFGSLPPRNSEK
jgi:hypothetical protein